MQNTHHYQHKSVGDSFFAKPVEGYPIENSLALTSAFIHRYWSSCRNTVHVHVKVGGIICCCAGGEDKPAEPEMIEKKEEEKQASELN